ncbi:MAG: hypothetical protein ACI8RD_014506 [Bacillariaceae sp.]|jgi:hypothetical protein
MMSRFVFLALSIYPTSAAEFLGTPRCGDVSIIYRNRNRYGNDIDDDLFASYIINLNSDITIFFFV